MTQLEQIKEWINDPEGYGIPLNYAKHIRFLIEQIESVSKINEKLLEHIYEIDMGEALEKIAQLEFENEGLKMQIEDSRSERNFK